MPSPLAARPWLDEVLYMILVDRFHRGAGSPTPDAPFKGGNLRGILEKLDYLQDLGVTALWLSPLYKNQADGYHGYWPVDFFSVDPRFGTLEELVELVDECHRRGLRVLLDMVLNHAGYDHPFTRDPAKKRWFHPNRPIRWLDQRSLERGSLHGLPDFAHEKPEVEKYLLDSALWWLEKTGVDGFRLDAVKHVPSRFWKKFSAELHRRAGPDFLLLGEVYRGVPAYIARYQREDGIDSVFDVPFADTVRSALVRDCETPGPGLWTRLMQLKGEYRTMLLNEILRKLTARRPSDMRWFSRLFEAEAAYEHPELLATIIDNHDVARFASEADRPERLKLALTLLLTWRGMPVLTYGTETGMEGRTDGGNRAMMDFRAQPELRAFTKRLIAVHRATPALGHGKQSEVHADREVYAFERRAENSRAFAAFNNSSNTQERTFRLEGDAVWRDALDGGAVKSSGGKLRMRLRPRSAVVLASTAVPTEARAPR